MSWRDDSDNDLDLDAEERDRLSATARLVLKGEFDLGHADDLRVLAVMLSEARDARCQRAAGYIHCLLQQRKQQQRKE